FRIIVAAHDLARLVAPTRGRSDERGVLSALRRDLQWITFILNHVFGEDDLRSRGVTVYHDQRIADGHVERIALRPGRTVLILIRRPASICAFDALPALVGAATEDQLGIIGVEVCEALRVLATE